MKHVHVIISKDLRKPPRNDATAVNNDLVVDTGAKDKDGFPVVSITKRPVQLHAMGESADVKNANILYAAEWDGQASFVTVLKGSIKDIKMAYAGWPMCDSQESYDKWAEEQAAKEVIAAAARAETERLAREAAEKLEVVI